MTDMNDELRRALRRVEPPAGFAEHVVDRVADGDAPATAARQAAEHVLLRRPLVRWATAAALAIGVTGGGVWYRAEQRQAQGEEARRQVLIGLRIASDKLQSVQLKLNSNINQRRARQGARTGA
jgi:hypothetical protein